MHSIQKVTLILYAVKIIFLFSYSLWIRKKISVGSAESTLLPFAIVIFLVQKLEYFYFTDSQIILGFGLALFFLGTILGQWAFRHLGFTNSDDFWLARKEKKERYLVTTGPYTYIRHPIFISLAIQYLGLVIVFAHPISILLWFLALAVGIVTSLNEEKFMLSQFPEYATYMKRTGRFFLRL